jgi:protein TonB
MPSTLFDQTLTSGRKNRKPVGTVTISIALHALALAAYVTLQMTTGLGGPPVISRLRAFVADPDVPKPPPVAPAPVRASTPVDVNLTAAPLDQPSTIEPEPPALLVASTDSVPGSFFTGPTATIPGPPAGKSSAPPEPTPAPPAGPVRVGGDIRPPARVSYVPPVYPDIARAAHVEGTVKLEATIDEWGVVTNVVVRQSAPMLDKAAIDAVSKWRYAPTRLNGQPIAIVMMVTVTFTLRNP